MVFPIWKCNTLHELSRDPTVFEKFSTRKKVVLVSFFQNKFYNAVFIFRFFMNLQRQNVTSVTVTYVTNFSLESF